MKDFHDSSLELEEQMVVSSLMQPQTIIDNGMKWILASYKKVSYMELLKKA